MNDLHLLETISGIRLLGPRENMIQLAAFLYPTCSFDGVNVSIRDWGVVATVIPE